jgi:hypothetical protein
MATGVFVAAVVIGAALAAKAQADAAEAQAEQAFLEEIQMESEGRLAETQAIQEEGIRREELRRMLSANSALAGGSGSSIGGRGFLEASGQLRGLVERDIANTRVIGATNKFRTSLGLSAARSRQSNALHQGRLAVAGTFIGAAGGIAGGFAGGSGAPPVQSRSLFNPAVHGSGITQARVG